MNSQSAVADLTYWEIRTDLEHLYRMEAALDDRNRAQCVSEIPDLEDELRRRKEGFRWLRG